MRINVRVLALAHGDRFALCHVLQTTPPRGCFSFADGILRLAPEDVHQYRAFIVRIWAHPAGLDMVEWEILAHKLGIDGTVPGRITRNDEEEAEEPPRRLESGPR